MATAVTTGTPAEEAASGKERGGVAEARRFQAHKPGEGYATRLGMMVVIMSYVGYACHHWFYNWVFLRDFFDNILRGTFLGILTNWMYEPTAARYVASIGTVVLAVGGFLMGYYYIYLKRRSAEFLIKTDGELNKVTWPKATPWFKADTQVWGATYVVLIVVALMTVYVFGIDLVLQWIAHQLFYGGPGT